MARASSDRILLTPVQSLLFLQREILRNSHLWHSVGQAGKDLWVICSPETAFSIDMDLGPLAQLN